MAYAIISTGGKQYRAEPGSQLTIERLPSDAGTQISFDQVLLVRDDSGVTVGEPLVGNAHVLATIVQQTRDKKVLIHKHKKRKKYRVTRGHRQYITRVHIDSIEVGGAPAKSAAPAPAPTEMPPPPPAIPDADETDEPAATGEE